MTIAGNSNPHEEIKCIRKGKHISKYERHNRIFFLLSADFEDCGYKK